MLLWPGLFAGLEADREFGEGGRGTLGALASAHAWLLQVPSSGLTAWACVHR